MSRNIQLGSETETAACLWLEQQGLLIIERNFRCKPGEIDIVAKDQNTLVFVEVRQRSHRNFGDGFSSVDYRKQQKLIRAARWYLQERKLFDQYPCRFDIVSARSANDLEWIKDAFQV